MFVMMNAARLGVGNQSLGLTEVAYQNALAYAKDRVQMRSLTGVKAPGKPADPIIVHPDVRRMLMTAKAYAEGGRALACYCALLLDKEINHPDEAVRAEAAEVVALLTPIVKAFTTDNAWEATSACQQVFGGHGYIKEWGMEQFVRDARINMIYEKCWATRVPHSRNSANWSSNWSRPKWPTKPWANSSSRWPTWAKNSRNSPAKSA
jgi:alkylation response protein AidB-like acyl-CoA dehydrogenase